MRKTFVSLLAVATVLGFAVAPASANSHNHGFGLGALVAGFAGAVIGAEIASHSEHAYHERDCFTRYQNVYDDYGNFIGRRTVSRCD